MGASGAGGAGGAGATNSSSSNPLTLPEPAENAPVAAIQRMNRAAVKYQVDFSKKSVVR